MNIKRSVVSLFCRGYTQYFLSRLKNASEIQSAILWKYISKAKDTLYGKKMSLSGIKTIEEFQRNIPLQSYEDLSAYIEMIKRGEKNILFPAGEKLIMFALSSGTTGAPKFIPVTRSFYKSYKRGSLSWDVFMFLSYPEVLDGIILPVVSSASEDITPDGIPCGGISGLIAQSQSAIARNLYCVPYSAYNIKDMEDKYYTILRLALQEKNIRFISSANPGTLISLGKFMEKWKQDLIADIAAGDLKVKHSLPENINRAIGHYLRKDSKRAGELEKIASRYGCLTPQLSWPSLYLISCWKGGTVGQYLPLLKEYYGDVPVYELGLLASEGRMSIPFEKSDNQGVLDIFSNFYEFIPEEEEDDPSARTLLMKELEKGKRYFIIITTPYGFFRYHIHDLIEVKDFCNGVPVIAFLNKGRHISSLAGEKLTEFQVCEAVRRTGEIIGEEYTLLPCWDNHLPYYSLVAEGHLVPAMAEKFIERLDKELKGLNVEYRSKRESLRLGAIRLISAPQGIFSNLKKDIIEKQGGRIEQYKQVHLDVQKKILPYLHG